MRLTADLVFRSPVFLNTLNQREVDLRGNKIVVIENLGATEDQFDTVDLSDNEILKLDGFPFLPHLSSLLLHNNRITSLAEDLEQSLPSLETLMLTNNRLATLKDLDPLSSLKTLRTLSLVGNPVTKQLNYRLYIVHLLPQLRILDFSRIKMKERRESKRIFGVRAKTPSEPTQNSKRQKTILNGLSEEEQKRIRDAIKNAKSLEEISELENKLASGKLDTISNTTNNS